VRHAHQLGLHQCLRGRVEAVADLRGREPQRLGKLGHELITERMTNKQIAAQLFLSEKTIESHIRNVFHKLGASSRVEVARAIERDRREREASAEPA
jgi:DNA-binding CsgD family transcriptional regulator